MKGIDPANSYSTCLVLIPDANTLYQSFAEGLREAYGKLPIAGIPRITKPSNKNAAGDYPFNVVDPSGNYIRFIQQVAQTENVEPESDEKTPLTKIGRAIKSADLIATAKGDFAAAASTLDKALADNQADASPIERTQALVLRAEIAINMSDKSLAKNLLDEVSQVMLTEDERTSLQDELQKMDDLAQLLD